MNTSVQLLFYIREVKSQEDQWQSLNFSDVKGKPPIRERLQIYTTFISIYMGLLFSMKIEMKPCVSSSFAMRLGWYKKQTSYVCELSGCKDR